MSGTIIYISGKCNQNCVFCLGKSKMKKEVYEKLIKSAKGRLIVSGGEPLMSEDIFNVLKLCKKNKSITDVEFQSNGAILSYGRIVDKIVRLKVVTEFNINFPALDKKTDEIITESNLFEYRMKGIANLIKRKQNVRLTFVINKFNYMQMSSYLKFVYEKFKNLVSTQLSFVQIQGRVRNNDSIVPTYSLIKKDLVNALEFAEHKKMDVAIDNIPHCISYPYYRFSIDYYKTQLNDFSFHNKKNIGECRSCKLLGKCFGPPCDYLEKYGSSELDPVK